MDFRQLFINLTQYTVPFGYEKTLESFLPRGWNKDSIGNYYYTIGNSETLFTSHLDTASKDRQKVNHIVEGDIIKTDGTTILGGDNKAGCVILFYMIENNVPGTYYFFLGEEISVHNNYPYGSLLAIEENPEFFKKFKRVVSFDRKETGQLITRQLGRKCCSDEFAIALIEDFKKNGIVYETDKTGYYTDSAFFGDLIPEIVNLSAGVWNEHEKTEYVNIKYIESVAKASINIKWDKLPIVRKLSSIYTTDSRKDSIESKLTSDQEIFKSIFTILDDLYFVCHEIRSYQNYVFYFKPNRKYHFTKWHEDDELEISINNGIIISNGIEYSTLDGFKKSLGIEKMDSESFYKMILSEFKKSNNKLSDARFNYLLYLKGGDIDDLKSNLDKSRLKMNKIGKGYEIIKESFIIKNYNSYIKNKNNI